MPRVYRRIRPIVFCLDPETAHNITINILALGEKLPLVWRCLTHLFAFRDPRLEISTMGLRFCNPVGVAAGYDKNAQATRGLAALGASHVEVGTITPLPQIGAQRPRLFRLPKQNAMINRLGFPNSGAATIAPRLARLRSVSMAAHIGVNIGKGHKTPIERAPDDYDWLLQQLHPYADYLTINISSPNTLSLRDLQAKEALRHLLDKLVRSANLVCPNTPILVKIAPDLSLAEIDEVLEVITNYGISGIVATNTTTSRVGLSEEAITETGGVSGPPLRDLSTNIIRHIYRQMGSTLPIIGVGGVDSASTALDKIRAGAVLVQVYTGLVYQGPSMIKSINSGIVQVLDSLGIENLMELVGSQA